jgi:hypothetical protein
MDWTRKVKPIKGVGQMLSKGKKSRRVFIAEFPVSDTNGAVKTIDMGKNLLSIAFAAGLMFLAGCKQTPVFESDFTSSSLVKIGGSATLITNSMAAITGIKPFGDAGGPALIVSNCCVDCSDCSTQEPSVRGMRISFADQTNSLASIFHEIIAAGVTNHLLSGAIDFFVMAGISTDIPSEQPSYDDCRCMDVNDKQASFRFVIRGRSGTNALCDVQFINQQTNCFLTGGDFVNYVQTPQPTNKPFLKPGHPYHLAVTFKTSSDCLTTMALWIKEGTGAISTCHTSAVYSSVRFKMDEGKTPPSAFANTLFGNGQMFFGLLGKPTSPVPILFDRLRIWDEVPNSIPGL